MAVTGVAVDSTVRLSSTGTTSTITGVTFGSAFSGRVIVVPILTFSGKPLSATIGGVSATISVNGAGGLGVFLLSAVVPTGTSGSVVITSASSNQALSYGAVALTGAASAAPSDTIDTDTNSGSIDVGAGGCIVAIAYNDGSSGSWTGATQIINNLADGASVAKFENSGGALTGRTVSYSIADAIVAAAFDASGGGGGGVSANPTTATSTSAAGTPTVSGKANVSVTGASATASAGTLVVRLPVSASVTGVSSTTEAGTPTVTGKSNTILPGVGSTASAGTPTVAAQANTSVTGAPATAAAGDPSVSGKANASVTGNDATASAGTPTVTGAANVTLASNAIVAEVGSPDVTASGGVTASISGNEATASAGALTAAAAANVAVTGVEASFSAGTLTVSGAATAALAGNAIAAQAGDVTVTSSAAAVSVELVGIEATARIGVLTAQDNLERRGGASYFTQEELRRLAKLERERERKRRQLDKDLTDTLRATYEDIRNPGQRVRKVKRARAMQASLAIAQLYRNLH